LRKSPYHHSVSHHIRAGVSVHEYERGHGRKPTSTSVQRLSTSGKFAVTVVYNTGREKVNVDSNGYLGALDSGLMHRNDTDSPRTVIIRRT